MELSSLILLVWSYPHLFMWRHSPLPVWSYLCLLICSCGGIQFSLLYPHQINHPHGICSCQVILTDSPKVYPHLLCGGILIYSLMWRHSPLELSSFARDHARDKRANYSSSRATLRKEKYLFNEWFRI